MFTRLPPRSKIAEIGVFEASLSYDIVRLASPDELILVDTWSGASGSGDKDGGNIRKVTHMEDLYVSLCASFISNKNVRLLRVESRVFFRIWPVNYFDAVYIDADHGYESVLSDLIGAYHLSKPGGYIMGHDYNAGCGVIQAVTEFCATYNQRITGMTANDRCPSFMIVIDKQASDSANTLLGMSHK